MNCSKGSDYMDSYQKILEYKAAVIKAVNGKIKMYIWECGHKTGPIISK